MPTSSEDASAGPPPSPDHNTSTPASTPVRDAATVVLLRDGSGSGGREAFTLTRTTTMAFSAGATVFPGGRVESSDDLPAQL